MERYITMIKIVFLYISAPINSPKATRGLHIKTDFVKLLFIFAVLNRTCYVPFLFNVRWMLYILFLFLFRPMFKDLL